MAKVNCKVDGDANVSSEKASDIEELFLCLEEENIPPVN
jgi:hypothetical protein